MRYLIPERSLTPPEADERVKGYCEKCDCTIYEDDDCFEVNHRYYCEKCVRPDGDFDDCVASLVFAKCPACGEDLTIDHEFSVVGGVPYCTDCVERIIS